MDDFTHQFHLTLRDYFAAHAPAMPDWFTCVPQRQEPTVPSLYDILPQELHSQYAGLHDWLSEDEVDPRVVQAYNQIEQACEVLRQWQRECEIERFIAWPWYYADLMTKARDA